MFDAYHLQSILHVLQVVFAAYVTDDILTYRRKLICTDIKAILHSHGEYCIEAL